MLFAEHHDASRDEGKHDGREARNKITEPFCAERALLWKWELVATSLLRLRTLRLRRASRSYAKLNGSTGRAPSKTVRASMILMAERAGRLTPGKII